jgi:predicted RND superfamily exporter protein
MRTWISITTTILTKDHKYLLLFITPSIPPFNTGENELFLSELDSIIASLSASSNDLITAEYFGASAVALSNARQLRKDATLTQGVTLVFLILFIGFYFRRKRAPLVILVPVVFGALFALSLIYLIQGHLSVIALAGGSVVYGIAVNYSLHMFNHFRHRRDLRVVLADLAMPLTIGSLTTIGGFLCLQFTRSEMLQDLGLFTALSLIGASLSSLIILPHLIPSGKTGESPANPSHSWIDKFSAYSMEHNKALVSVICLLTVVFAYTSQFVGFDDDMNKMNYMSAPLKKAETNLNRINSFTLQSVFLITEGKTMNEALITNEKMMASVEELRQEGFVKKYSGVSTFVFSDSLQRVRIDRWNRYWTQEKKAQVTAALLEKGAELKFSAHAFDPFLALLNTPLQPEPVRLHGDLNNDLLEDFISEDTGRYTIVNIVKVNEGKKQRVYDTFGHNPQVTVMDKQYMAHRFVDTIHADFLSIAIMTSVMVFVVLLLTYGRIELALVTFVPMFITWIWILGMMGIFGIQFNIINIVLSALIFGLGDDYSLFIMDGLLQEYKTGKKNLSSFKSSILLSAITTVAGLGVLIFAKHPGLKSIALISYYRHPLRGGDFHDPHSVSFQPDYCQADKEGKATLDIRQLCEVALRLLLFHPGKCAAYGHRHLPG